MKVYAVRTAYAKNVPYIWPDIFLNRMGRKEIVPLDVIIDGKVIPIRYSEDISLFGESPYQ